jgi:hypothetical protein
MSAPQVDEDLKRDLQALGAVYPDDVEPPTQADDAIRAAARRAVRSKPGGESFWWPHTPPLAAAAVLVLTVSIAFLAMDDPMVQELQREPDVPAKSVQVVPAPSAPSAALAADEPAKVAPPQPASKAAQVVPPPKEAKAALRADANTRARDEASSQAALQLEARAKVAPAAPPAAFSQLAPAPEAVAPPPQAFPAPAPSAPAAPARSAEAQPAQGARATVVEAVQVPPPAPAAAASAPAQPARVAAAEPTAPVAAARAPAANEIVLAPKDDPRLKALEKRERYEAAATVAAQAQPVPASSSRAAVAADSSKPVPTEDMAAKIVGTVAEGPVMPAASAARPGAVATPAVARKSAPPMLQDDPAAMPQLWAGSIRAMQLGGRTKEAEQEIARFKQRYPAYPIDEVLKTPVLFMTKADIEASSSAWLLHIRGLRATNQMKEADAELVRFRQRYPNNLLPEELKSKEAAPKK